jgi:multidrug efflux pump subunit AcrA (membrane-fusion protein)
MKRSIIITGILVVVAIIILIVIGKMNSKKDISNLYAEAKKGQFDIIVTTTGELQAENSTDIFGPQITQSRNIRAADIKITDMVAEGTEVKLGDYVATLDKTTFDNTLKDELERLVTSQTNLEVKILDTAVTLSNLRDNIKNLKFTVDEAEITVLQSKYEPPTTAPPCPRAALRSDTWCFRSTPPRASADCSSARSSRRIYQASTMT